MGIKTIDANEVLCQKCDTTIIVAHWQDARKHGWVVPCDGALQLCPRCADVHRGMLMATAVPG